MSTNKIVESINPVMDTARMTLSYLAKAGIKEAGEFAAQFGLQDYGKTNYDAGESTDEEKSRIIMQEARFEYINNLIAKQNTKNILDIACGFSPRGLIFARKGYKYIGVDLQAAISALSPVSEKISAEENLKGSFEYRMADITNPKAFSDISKEFDGPITVVCEGLFMYLGPHEVDSFINGLKAILARNGGCFITPDFASQQAFAAVTISMLGKDEAMKVFERSRATIVAKSDTNMTKTLMGTDDKLAYDFFTERGIQIKHTPYLSAESRLISASQIRPEQYAAVESALSNINCWIATYTGEEAKVDAASSAFTCDYILSATQLTLKPAGRIDSLTAPDFLAVFDNIAKDTAIDNIIVDMHNLEYISSAGLRTLLMMKKRITGELTAISVNNLVKDIITQTGFDSIITMA